MKIVDRATFLAMPPETLYSKYQPCVFDELCIKGDTLVHDGKMIDWFYQSIADSIRADNTSEYLEKLEDSQANGASVRMDFDIQSRDGCFDEEQLFAIWEPQDVAQLINRLQLAIRQLQEG